MTDTPGTSHRCSSETNFRPEAQQQSRRSTTSLGVQPYHQRTQPEVIQSEMARHKALPDIPFVDENSICKDSPEQSPVKFHCWRLNTQSTVENLVLYRKRHECLPNQPFRHCLN